MSKSYSELQLEATCRADRYVVSIAGELDWFGCLALNDVLIEARQGDADCIIVDLENLTFIESKGLALLWSAAGSSAAAGKHLNVSPGKGQVARMFRLLGFDSTLTGEFPEPQPTAFGLERAA